MMVVKAISCKLFRGRDTCIHWSSFAPFLLKRSRGSINLSFKWLLALQYMIFTTEIFYWPFSGLHCLCPLQPRNSISCWCIKFRALRSRVLTAFISCRTKCQQGLWKFWELSHVHHESCSGIILNVLLVTAILCVCWNKYLVRVSVEVKILQEARSKFTEQEIVCVIDGPEAPVCVVVGTGACTEWTHWGSEEGGVYKEGRGESGKQEFEKRDSKYCCHHFCSGK